jgi:hypothetical protein
VSDLERAIQEFIEVRNENPKPFLWTKSANGIPESISRFEERTMDVDDARKYIARIKVTGY